MFKKKFRKIMALWKCGESVEGVWNFSTERQTKPQSYPSTPLCISFGVTPYVLRKAW